ncbi:MAG: (Fe-S)-binding protein, partial [Candidatus Hydrothermarchaeaceae archaeon]
MPIEDFVKTCYQCGMCSGVCPKAIVKPGFLPRKMVHEMITGHVERGLESGDAWDCLTCGTCQDKCPMNVDFLDMVRESRRAGKGANCKVAHDNTLGMDFYNILKNKNTKPRRKKFLSEDVRVDDDSDVLYFMGCVTYLDIIFKDDVGFEGMDIADNTIRLLNAVGITPAVLDGEKCCGHDQFWRGQNEFFEEFAKQNVEHLKKYKTIVTSCPECYRTLAVDYKERLGIELNVKHISELLVEKVGEIEPNGSKKVTFHDSCRLGRYMNVYDQPRELLKKAGHEVLEMAKTREESICCGVSAFVN